MGAEETGGRCQGSPSFWVNGSRILKALGSSFKTRLWSKARHIKEVEVSQVGQADQCVFAVVFLSRGAEQNHGHLPHPTPFVRCELEFSLGAHFGKREHLQGDLAS